MAVAAGLLDRQQMPLYDRVIIAANTATTNPIQFFVTPIGSGVGISGGVKQKWDTNLTQPSRLESPKSFKVRALRVYFSPDILLADMVSFMKNYVVSCIVGEKEYQLAPVWFFPGGGSIFGLAATTATSTTITNWSNGVPQPQSINVIDAPLAIDITQNENFRVEFQGNTFTTTASGSGGTGANITVALDGVLTRQVQ